MKTKIGGQAVIEGVMMRGATSEVLTCRDEMGQLRVESKRLPAKKPWYRKVPFLRGVINLIISMIDGTKIIGKSAEVMVEDLDVSEGDGGMGGLLAISMLLGVVLAMALFVVLPTAITTGIFALFDLDEQQFAWLKSLIEGVAKLAVLVGYMASISQMKEIKRVFMYHGAEHKTIACYEAELPLTVENVQKCSRYHDRCGTSFLVFVVVLSVLLMMVLDVVCVACGFTAFIEKKNWWLRALLKIALLPLTAGISYEMLMLLARSNFVLFRPFKWLGKQFQRITTKEPDDSMCEVAICSFTKVLAMDADPSIPEQPFPAPITVDQFRQHVKNSPLAEGFNDGNIDWLLGAILHVKQDALKKDLKIPFGWTVRVDKMSERLQNGEPFARVLGVAEFFGRNFTVTEDTLIPRMETELVCEQLLKNLNQGDSLLDMCCGTGILGITAALEKGCKVTLVDVSKKTLKVAKANAKANKAKAKFVQSDMFANVSGKSNCIVCNPPYIATEVIATLDDSVKNYDPHLALDGGDDGLDFYRILAKEARNYLLPGGTLVLEIGYDQGEAVTQLFKECYDVSCLKDYGNNDRIVIAKLK